MSDDLAVSVRNLTKRYQLGEHHSYMSLRSSVRRALSRSGPVDHEELVALDDVSFDVPSGSVVGIIGHNGAGKSTLLRILSRITDPSEGRIEMIGRVSALLEVGTGFHPELTGRENVMLNGSILGMSQQQIRARFDEIVDFAEVEQFIDTPIKRYSSGMQLRLAFAVAAFLEPEILIVDEVLAVGDVAFQRKCLGRLEEGARSGRTVLFVSHNLSAIRTLCPRSILLDHGRIVFDGPTTGALDRYLENERQSGSDWDLANSPRPVYETGGRLSLLRAEISGGGDGEVIESGADVAITIEFEATGQVAEAVVVVNVMTNEGEIIAQAVSATNREPFPVSDSVRYTVRADLPGLALQPRTYLVGFGLRSEFGLEDEVTRAGVIEVVEAATVESPMYGSLGGFFRLPVTWTQLRSADER